MLNEQVWRNINCDVHAVQQNEIENIYSSNVHVPVVMTDALSFVVVWSLSLKSRGCLQHLFFSYFNLVKNCTFWVEIAQ